MIRAQGVCKTFRRADGGLLRALDGVSFEVKTGQLAVVAGPNGSGKSLLMRILAGLEEPSRGSVEADGRVGLVFQDADAQILGDTPLEDVLFGLRMGRKGPSKEEANRRAVQALRQVGLEEKMDSPTHFLSGGEKRRLAIASVLALEREIIILDEPYSNLDFPGVKSVNGIISDLKGRGLTVLLLTHEIEKCLALADRFLVIYRGQKVCDVDVDQTLGLDLEAWGIRNPDPGGDRSRLLWI